MTYEDCCTLTEAIIGLTEYVVKHSGQDDIDKVISVRDNIADFTASFTTECNEACMRKKDE